MKRGIRMLSALLLGALFIVPAGAFSADSLEISIEETGDAAITFTYSLNVIERWAVFLQIARPELELKSAIESFSGKAVDVASVEKGSAQFSVSRFARAIRADGETQYETPALDLTAADGQLERYWFAPLVRPDFSPELTTIRFPDGHTETFSDQSAIPALSHGIA
ncbi:MAG: hypothetical protein KO206_08060 [Methanomicrobiaceae archaeon]|uniref:Uncharacterized protein n=1 Tax=hydrocarbon metagenome TaxID=938273 RepID=A0A0W8FER4_9ZZZZ|nr:hypothetical protein [Methanomicrobiaceae archaeon]MDD5418654.1 hypothetical protein [Methanomicrobiaceae archaeon]